MKEALLGHVALDFSITILTLGSRTNTRIRSGEGNRDQVPRNLELCNSVYWTSRGHALLHFQ